MTKMKIWSWWWLPLLCGTWLRLAHLPWQMLGGDEMHILRIVTTRSAVWIMTHYSDTDYGIPLALFLKVWMRLQLPVSEMILRLPMLITGILFLAFMPLIARHLLTTKIAHWFAWLLAIAPSLVFYSRIIRTYMPVILLAHGAVWCFYFWFKKGQRHWAVGYVILAALAVYWHLIAAPFVIFPLLFAVWRKWRMQTSAGFSWLYLGSLTAITLGSILLLQLPALPSLIEISLTKSGEGSLDGTAVYSNLFLQAGTRWVLVMTLFWVLVIGGGIYLYRHQSDLAQFTLWLMVGHFVGLFVLNPLDIQAPQILSRYIILVLPLVLMWVASGIAWLQNSVERFKETKLSFSGWFAAATIPFFFFLSGPFARPEYWQTNLTHHNDFIRFNCDLPTYSSENIPVFYQELASNPPNSVTILEYPWNWMWHYGHANLAYHLIHKQTIIGVSNDTPFLADERLSLHYLWVPSAPEHLLQSSARYLVVHRDLLAEEMKIEDNPCLNLPIQLTDPRGRNPRWQEWRDAAQMMISQLEQSWGNPFYEDESLVVWDLGKIREQTR